MDDSPPAVVICDGTESFVQAAVGWEPGQPFPLLPGRELDRYRALFPGGTLPHVAAQPRAGLVVSVGGDVSRAAGRLLATATSRPHRHVRAERMLADLAAHQGELVAVVGLTGELAMVGDWPGMGGAHVGVLPGRSEPALISLVYRTLTVESAGEDRFFVFAHPLFRSALEADAVELSELQHVRERRVKVLVLHGQGRECSSGVLDSTICGRRGPLATTPALPLSEGLRMMPCLRGDGCFRTDLTEDEMVPAADLHAMLVFTQSCNALTIGINAYPQEISFTLGILEGTAVAVIGAVGVHVQQRTAKWDLEDGLAAHLPLGEVTSRLNERSNPAMNRYGLLGDPGLVLDWRDVATRDGSGRKAREDIELDRDSVDGLAHLNHVVLPRLEALCWMEIGISGAQLQSFRERIRDIAFDPHDSKAPQAARQLSGELADMQRHVFELLLDRFYTQFWSFGERVYYGLRHISRVDVTCPSCGRPIAERIVMRHRIEPALHLQTVQCRRCGDVWWSTEPGELTVELGGPVDVDVPSGRRSVVERRIANRGREVLHGAVGYAFRSRRSRGMPPAWCQAYELPPGQMRTIQAPVDLADRTPQLDTHAMPFASLLNGIYTTSMVMVRLT